MLHPQCLRQVKQMSFRLLTIAPDAGMVDTCRTKHFGVKSICRILSCMFAVAQDCHSGESLATENGNRVLVVATLYGSIAPALKSGLKSC